jgi:hypothetical protein
MNRETEPLSTPAPARNQLCDVALGATALTGALYLSDALAAQSNVSFGATQLAICPVIVLAARRGGVYLAALGVFATLYAMVLQSLLFDSGAGIRPGVVSIGLYSLSVLACGLQLALTVQVLDRRRPEHNPWRRAVVYGGTVLVLAFAAFLLIHRPVNAREWWGNVKMALIVGVYQAAFMRYFAPLQPVGSAWGAVFKALKASTARQRTRRG